MYKNINIIILFFALIFSYIGGFCNNNEIISKKDTAHIYEFEIVDDLGVALELNVFNPPAILIDGQIVFDKKWPSQEALERLIEILK